MLLNLETLQRLADKVDAAGPARLAVNTEWKPRIERLADKYGLEGLERDLFVCSFVIQVGAPGALYCRSDSLVRS